MFWVGNAYAGDVRYVYDDLGRLIAVIDVIAGEAAIYQYDAVGNLLGIVRQPTSTVAILNFTPKSGPIGTTVTISGTGYSPTASQNTVTFNGAPATITSATSTQLVVTVPTGATTGPIGVTTPSGSATSSTPFTVPAPGTPVGSPTISSFTPTIGASGTAVTVSGANFGLTPFDNRMRLNTTPATITTASFNSLTANVPAGAGSGRIAVSTALGQAVSSDDFFVPPSPYTAADVEVATRMAIGESKTVTITTANKIGLVLFEGTAGQSLGLGITNVTYPNGDVVIFDPYGAVFISQANFTSSGRDLHSIYLPVTGTYTIQVNPWTTNTGSVTLTLSEDIRGTIVIDGAPLIVTIPNVAQRAWITFNGTAGQRLGLGITNVTYAEGDIYILNPDGTTLYGATDFTAGGRDSHVPVLPTTGTYTIQVNPHYPSTGSITLTLSEDIAGAIAINGASLTVTIPRVAQRAWVTFSGAAGQRLGLGITSVSSAHSDIYILKPDGSTLLGQEDFGAYDTSATLPVLPVSGTYTIQVNPWHPHTGSLTLTLSEDVTGSLTFNGSAVPINITRPGQNASMSFNGTAGQSISVTLTNSTFPAGAGGTCGHVHKFIIWKPDNTTLVNKNICSGVDRILEATLPVTGTYLVQFDPQDVALIGSVALTLYEVIHVTGTIAMNGSPVPVSLLTPGQNASLTFTGTANQRVSVRLINSTFPATSCPTFTHILSLLKPDNTTLTTASYCGTQDGFFDAITLPVTGTYTLFLDPQSLATGSATLQLYQVVDVSGSLTLGASPSTVTMSTPGQVARFTFATTKRNQKVTVRVTSNTLGTVTVSLLDAANATITSTTSSAASFNLAQQTLATVATYTVLIDPSGANTGSLNLQVTSP